MSKKSEIKKQILESEAEIESLEKKRMRSQSAIMEANINNVPPNSSDIEYFKVYTKLIALERENLKKLNAELNK